MAYGRCEKLWDLFWYLNQPILPSRTLANSYYKPPFPSQNQSHLSELYIYEVFKNPASQSKVYNQRTPKMLIKI